MTRIIVFSVTSLMVAFLSGCGAHSGLSAAREGAAAFNEGKYEKAAVAFERATARISDSANLYYNLGVTHLRLGNMDKAQTALKTACELDPEQASALVCLAQIAYYRNDLPEASVYLNKALLKIKEKDERARALTTLGFIEIARQRYDYARLSLLEAIRLNKDYAPARYNLATLYRDTYGLKEEALEEFELFKRVVDRKDAHFEKANNSITRLQLNLERTKADQGASVRRDSPTAAKLLNDAILLHQAKQYAKALKTYRDALLADPQTFSAAYGAGMVCIKLNKSAEAIDAFKTALDINPNNQDCYAQLARLMMQVRQTAEAAKVLDRAIARSPYNPVSYDLMARIRYAEGRFDEAWLYGRFYVSLIPAADPSRASYEHWLNSFRQK